MNPPLAIENLKIQWEFNFWFFLNTDQNTKKIYNCNYIVVKGTLNQFSSMLTFVFEG